jgi:hypothetical protein
MQAEKVKQDIIKKIILEKILNKKCIFILPKV